MRALIVLIVLGISPFVIGAENLSIESLLQQVKQGHHQDQAVNERRLQEFVSNKQEQQRLLDDLRSQRQRAESLSQQKEAQFADNEQQIILMQDQLNQRLGSLKELFGVLQIATSDAQSAFHNSLVQIHYPQRNDRLQAFALKMEQTIELPSISEIEQLWFELHQEISESGKGVTTEQPVLLASGEEKVVPVTRIGTFNLISDGKYLQRIPETGQLVEFEQQPASRYLTGAQQLQSKTGIKPLTIDPIRGQLMSLLGTAPKWSDRFHQGGAIGYIIMALGGVVFLVALARLVMLSLQELSIEKQMRKPDQPGDNPLGRVFAVYQANKSNDLETLELKLSDAVLQEVPKINRWISFIKISAAIAPLMGLLGTVTGMIITFQAITLFGAGDPKLMAGGISQALVTTVLGLTVAIPSLVLHNLVQGKAAKLTDILEQESVAMVAEHAELQNGEADYASAA